MSYNLRVFLSSTFSDLKEYRAAAISTLQKIRIRHSDVRDARCHGRSTGRSLCAGRRRGRHCRVSRGPPLWLHRTWLGQSGELPRTQRRLVEAWAELHHEELTADWERLAWGQRPLTIAPLQ